ncbi:unnamed protein product [Durusdinium trenchii]|uniref:Potassium voltage-gated channel subfamily B member 1 (Voltage-gated potassium channel subunit Kv2.1) n=2 Tax=Durusdinium trenchii TaxID=1381693 RepID=A0ABP0SNM6_9DINO
MPFLPGVIIDSTSEGRGKVELEHSKKRSADSIGLGIEERLDRLSEQMDLCLAEVVALKPVGDLHPRSWSGVMPPLRARPSTTPSRGQLRVADPPSQRSSKRSARFSQKTDGSETTVVEQHVLQSRPTLATNHRGARERFKSQAVPRSMDLEIAWRLHAKNNREDEEEPVALKPLLRLVERSRLDMLWELLDDPSSSRTAWWVSQVLKGIVILSLLFSNLQTTEEPILDTAFAAAAETALDCIFLVEFLCRILSAPLKRSYALDPLNWADMWSAMGLPLRASIGFVISQSPATLAEDLVQHYLLFFLPLVRFLKLLRYFESFRLLIDACGKSAEALPVLIYMTALIVLLSATAIYMVEDRKNIPSMPHSLWLALVTMTTVGYGDYYPTSLAGYLTVSVLTFVSVLFLALPVGIIGHEFTMSWQSRTQVLLMTRFRKSLNKYGYGAEELRVLIDYVDVNGDGELAFDEFVELINQMRIGISREQAALLFGIFDIDQNGFVEHKEFLKHLFPQEYVRRQRSRNSKSRVSAAIEHLETLQSEKDSKASKEEKDDQSE